MRGKGKVPVNQPKLICKYEKGIDSVDTLGISLGSYQPNLCLEKRCWSLFSDVVNIDVAATFQGHTNVFID